MADFVAVIRRAVDGLSDNNPEMRSKVYEKARGAVRRQLEAMNPRPSDDLIQRQLDKLESAIANVESEHVEALPAAEEAAPEPAHEAPEPEPAPSEPESAEPVPSEPEPVEPEPVEPEPVEAEPVEAAAEEPQPEEIPYEEPAPVETVAEEPQSFEEPHPVAEETQSFEERHPVAEPEPFGEPAPAEPEFVEPAPAGEAAEPADAYEAAEPEEAAPAETEPAWHDPSPPVDDYVPSWQADEPVAAEPEPPVRAAGHAQEPPVAAAADPEADEPLHWHDPLPDLPPAEASPQEPAPPLEDFGWEWPEDRSGETEPRPEMPAAGGHEWGDLDDLLGVPGKAAPAGEPDAAMADAGLATAASAAAAEAGARTPQRSFRAEPRKPRLNRGTLALLVALLALVGGAGAAYWFNRDKVDAWVAETLTSLTGPAPAETETSEAAAPVTGEAAQTTPPSAAAETPQEETAASGGQDSSGKFTQRLLANGTEVDDGPAPSAEVAVAEGKSVAPQSEETAALATEENPAGNTNTGTASGTDAAQAPPAAADAGAADAQPPAAGASTGAAQKMFLYEERLGQTAPTAIEGTVAWSEAEESPGGDARPEPVVRAQINVPASGLTALITFRRNADKSLPASHIIEIVFSLPETFEGGGIESVQRVAMKRTEQDRGDQLIAVPAKITDDFHMIALNDFPEAIARNTELLRTRGWIDIPLTYRNGRRALITLDKGPSGTEAFETVMKAWAAQTAPNSQ